MSCRMPWVGRLSGAAWSRGILLLVAGGLALGCPLRSLPGVLGGSDFATFAECPGTLVPIDAIAGTFLLRQDIRLRSERLDVGLRLVVQKRGARLVLVGFNTLGIKAFTVVQEGTATTVDAPLGPAWAVPPLNVLRDLHRSRFLRVPGGPFVDDDVQTTRDGLTITERWREGVLVTRTLERTDGGTDAGVLVTFADGIVTIVNSGCAYEAKIVTTEERPL